jgi:hypothetical protein
MRPILIVLCVIVACLVCAPAAEAGPLCRLGQAAVSVASAPLRVVGAVRANRKSARQSRRGC